MTPSLNVGGMCMPVQPKHCSLKLRSACARRFAICPVYTFSLKSPSNMISEFIVFHTNSWAINCSKKYWPGRPQVTLGFEILFVLLSNPCAFQVGAAGSLGLVCHDYLSLFVSWTNFHPTPSTQTMPISTTSAEKCPIAIIAHPPCWLRCIHSLIICATMLLVSIPMPIIFQNCCSLVAWHQSACVLQPANKSVLNLQQSLFKALIFTPFVNTPRLVKFSITMQTQLSGLVPGALPYAGLRKKSSTCQVIWFFVLDSCWDIWKAISARWELLLRSRAVQFFFCIKAISSVADGHDHLMKSLVSVLNCLDWALNRQVALDSDQQLPWQKWQSLVEVHLFQWLWWPLLLPDPLGLRSEIIGFEYDLKLVATCVVPPFFFLLLLYSDLFLFVCSAGP